jgi:hypothetical protein
MITHVDFLVVGPVGSGTTDPLFIFYTNARTLNFHKGVVITCGALFGMLGSRGLAQVVMPAVCVCTAKRCVYTINPAS